MSGKAPWQRHERRTSGTEGVEDWLAGFVSRDISGATNSNAVGSPQGIPLSATVVP